MIRLSEKELRDSGFVEVRPNVFKYLTLAERLDKEKKDSANPYKHIKRVKVTINGKEYNFRSSWEHTYAIYLEELRVNKLIAYWEFEPVRFMFEKIKRGTNSYLPDFRIYELDGSHWWAEVKGHLTAKAKTQLTRMRKYYPNEIVKLITDVQIKQLRRR